MKSKALQIVAAIPQLVLYGILALPMFGLFVATVATGMGLMFVFLIGIVVFALLGVVMYLLARFEEARAGWTFDLDIPRHEFRQSPRTDGWKFFHTLALQWADSRTWIGILHGAVVSLLGLIAVFALHWLATGIAWLFAPLQGPTYVLGDFWLGEQPSWLALLLGLALIVIGAIVIVSLAFAHRALSKQLLVPNREAELQSEARVQSQHRQQAISAADIERARIERDLHDGVQPRLVAVGMTLGMAKRKLKTDPERASELIDEAHESTMVAVTELRQLVRGFQPAVLQDRGLDAALSALIGRSAIPVDIQVNLPNRYSDRAEATMYFAVAEAMTNAAKHAGATHILVRIHEENGYLFAHIEDNGRGGANRSPGGGIDGVMNRVTAAGGTYNFSSPEGGPTVIEVTVPCAS
ncbi:sensor histidine kinase [Gulosibacter molinativorax]|uniref:histidine kinase n=1 Tax=Gulosibacter molinativorax TaxID=256821 RepID=A0ABT7CAF0_9MICO|nr:sensor histidine kinase [Gulosibacter molinativorax]MDJ1372170.1 sensor histidine kinase [Gulosibacter molinativorax]QUY60959.1 Oxygen sensor histidine kinase NreB [Gulosibacter molinativorax]